MSKKVLHLSSLISVIKSIMFFFSALLMTCALFVFPDTVSESIGKSAGRCFFSILPSLFPMMVLSKQLVSFITPANTRFSELFSRITGFEKNMLPVFFISLICGYPLPAFIIDSMTKSGQISQRQAEKTVCLCNNSSPAFVILFIGKSILFSIKKGILLFAAQQAAVITLSRLLNKRKTASKYIKAEKSYHPPTLAENVAESSKNMLVLFGFVIFFSLAGDIAAKALMSFGIDRAVSIIISGFFEITYGISQAVYFTEEVKVLLVCLYCTMGGLSVFFQIRSAAPTCRVNAGKYFIIRFFVFVFTLFFYTAATFLFNTIYFDVFA